MRRGKLAILYEGKTSLTRNLRRMSTRRPFPSTVLRGVLETVDSWQSRALIVVSSCGSERLRLAP